MPFIRAFWEAKASGSLSLRPAWSSRLTRAMQRDPASEQRRGGYKGKNWKAGVQGEQQNFKQMGAGVFLSTDLEEEPQAQASGVSG